MALRARLEPDGPWPVAGQAAPNPVLQQLRRLLLLRSVDAGAVVRQRLQAAGVLQPDGGGPGLLGQRMHGPDDAALQRHWRQEWAQAFQGEGRDLRQRLQAGLLLGELGDNLRYDRRQMQDGSWHPGLRLKPALWAAVGAPGQPNWFCIGSDRDDDQAFGGEKPPFLQALDYFEMASCPVTVGEWTRFVAAEGYKDSQAVWWQAAGAAAQAWLRGRQGDNPGTVVVPNNWGHASQSNPLQPVTGITAHEALAYVAWAAPLYNDEVRAGQPGGLRLALPTEVQWEAGVRGGPAGPQDKRLQQRWPGQDIGQQAGALDFNHANTRWGWPSPVGVFSRSTTHHGVADAAGNVWQWCSNAVDQRATQGYEGLARQWAANLQVDPLDGQTERALRGGSFNLTSGHCRVAYRNHNHPRRRQQQHRCAAGSVCTAYSEP